jgi:hypothetical protein
MDKQHEKDWALQTQGFNWMARLYLARLAGLFGKPSAPTKQHVTTRRPRKFGEQ